MFDKVLSILAPHYCYGCGFIGKPLCASCKYNIVNEPLTACLGCNLPTSKNNLCGTCKMPYKKAWLVGERQKALKESIDAFKFSRVKALGTHMAELLDARLPILPSDVVVVPVPTVSSHVRQRGYDHAHLIAKRFAKQRQLSYKRLIQRATSSRQVNASAGQRRAQARQAFRVKGTVAPGTYLLIDDVVTTGATLKYASKVLLEAGAGEVWVAAIAKQTLR